MTLQECVLSKNVEFGVTDKKKKRRASKIDASIGLKIRNARTIMGITQMQLAKKLGLTFQQLQKYENGFNRISAATIGLLAEVLKINVSSFFPDNKVTSKKIPLKESRMHISQNRKNIDKEIENLIVSYNSIKSDKTRQKILSLVQHLSSIS